MAEERDDEVLRPGRLVGDDEAADCCRDKRLPAEQARDEPEAPRAAAVATTPLSAAAGAPIRASAGWGCSAGAGVVDSAVVAVTVSWSIGSATVA